MPSFFFFCLLLSSFLLLPSSSEGRDYVVGGSPQAWTLPRPSPIALSHWAHQRQFRVGDSLSWKYDQKSESVLEVQEVDYKTCNIGNPIAKHNDGDTKVTFNRTGPFYFISGTEGHCQQGLRLDPVVYAAHNGGNAPAPGTSPIPSPGGETPAPTPVNSATFYSGGFVGAVTVLGVTLLGMVMVI